MPSDDVVWRVEGPGATACLQGLVTNEIDHVALPSLRYGAVLTPKGMIVTTLWIRRDTEGFWLVVPAAGAAPLGEVLRRSLPPRLAKVTDPGETVRSWRLFGTLDDDTGLDLAVPDARAPFAALAIGDPSHTAATLADAGWQPAEPVVAHLAELLGGWPQVGSEIDERTLPQEVGFDALEGVKHDKGCYVGQETVARIHFRGHPNRTLRAMPGTGELPDDDTVVAGGKSVGTVTTLAQCGQRWLATAKLRREVAGGDTVMVGGRPAEVREFPVGAEILGG